MLPAAGIGRDRNNLKFSAWSFYIKDAGSELKELLHPPQGRKGNRTIQKLRRTAETHKARVPGSVNQALAFQQVSRNKVLISWPRPISADACIRVLRLALGTNWRDLVTDPAGVQGADQTAATAPSRSPKGRLRRDIFRT